MHNVLSFQLFLIVLHWSWKYLLGWALFLQLMHKAQQHHIRSVQHRDLAVVCTHWWFFFDGFLFPSLPASEGFH